MMQTTSITQLKNSLSAYLRDVKAGEEVLITDRGRPIARLVPVSSSDSMEEHLKEMERKGLLRRGTGRLPEDFWDYAAESSRSRRDWCVRQSCT